MKRIITLYCFVIGTLLLYANTAADKMLIYALQDDNLNEAKYWLEHGADANCTNEDGQPALTLAIDKDFNRHISNEKFDNSVALTELLLQKGANPNSNISLLPLSQAILLCGDYRLCNILIQHGANPHLIESYTEINKNAIDYARHLGYKRVADLLIDSQTYSSEYTVLELSYLIQISLNNEEYDETIKYCEQFYRQLSNELSSYYTGWLSNRLIYFFHESALFRKSLLAMEAARYDEAEELLLEAIHYEKERKRLGDTRDFGVDLDKDLRRIRNLALEAQGVSNTSIIDKADFVIQQGRYDTIAISILLDAASCAQMQSNYHLKDYYLRTAYQWVKTDKNLRQQISPRLYWQLLGAITGHYYIRANTTPILSEAEVSEASAYIEKTFGDTSIESLGYMLSVCNYYYFQNATYKAFAKNTALINKLDNLFQQGDNISEEMIKLYVEACLMYSGEEPHAYNTLKKLLDNTLFNKYLDVGVYGSFIFYCYQHHLSKEIWTYVPTYYQLNRAKVDKTLATLSETEAMYWWNTQPFFYDLTILMATKESVIPEHIAGELYNNELFKKDILLRSHTRMQQYLLQQEDSTFTHLYQQLIEQKAQLLQYQTGSYNIKQMQELAKAINLNEGILASISNTYAEQLREKDITWQDIQKKLKANEVAIEFLNTGAIDQYWALLLRKEYKYPILIYLPDLLHFYPEDITLHMNNWHQFGEQWGTAPPEFLQFAGDAGEVYQYGENGTKLYDALWKPLTQYIREGETVYFAPSGILQQLAVEALPIDDKHVLSDTYNLIRLSSTRELARLHHAETNQQAVLYGNIQYDVTDMELLTEQSAKYRGEEYVANRNSVDDLNRGTVKPLPGTVQEIHGIFRQLDAAHYQTNLLEALAANEESVKALSGHSPQILHIATHAFYWDNDRASNEPFVQHRTPQGEFVMINPLARCGLLFAGANMAYSGNEEKLPQGVEDGILTAEEISLLDLQQTKLLVLSACETGIGELTDAGVFGLQRAFKMAGVETIIMSLWKVDDRATQMLMTEFYHNWVEKKQTKREAFTNAQKAVRFAVDKDGDRMYESPYYWAGFIMLD